MCESNETQTRKEILVLPTSFGYRRAVPLIIVILVVAMSGAPAQSQHSLGASQQSDLQAWADLQQSMRVMHHTMSSIHSTGNDDEDFVRLMLPHHQAALDMAKVELMHGQDSQMRRLAQEIIADQESEIELMQVWLRQNHPGKPRPGSSAAKEQ